ncbi:unnamed protein product [Vitrella brassicaformis CCMP3155]|uniref:Carbohydrate kinase PfkB domain-containing protein n=2 Tax=Vitrella brassicaformis TaxID=1169539 RepID=A0A0G4FNW6_VITBC|nr:unnamed protein product [Vitrella brassicaformis CCMP3155]|eukprot:CEM15919.1 unnamed protein product [Vitrella brassicaformis CCMP3155]
MLNTRLQGLLVLLFVSRGIREHFAAAFVLNAAGRNERSLRLRGTHRTVPTMKVLCVGAAGVDFLARVAAYPEPDDKIRTESLSIEGGGNAGNTCTALSRLGVKCGIITCVGDDSNGQTILNELREDGIDTSLVLTYPGVPSPFTYVIVDEAAKTRTCIHTPCPKEMGANDVADDMFRRDAGIRWVHSDARQPAAACRLAELAKEAGVTISLDAEKDREGLPELLALADVLFTNSRYPKQFAPSSSPSSSPNAPVDSSFLHGMRHLSAKCPTRRLVCSTLGERGAVMLMPCPFHPSLHVDGPSPLRSHVPVKLRYATVTTDEIALVDWCDEPPAVDALSGEGCHAAVHCSAWPIDESEIVDTTGAGDAFIGGVIFGLLRGWCVERVLVWGGLIAHEKLKHQGARSGLPRLDNEKLAELLGQFGRAK